MSTTFTLQGVTLSGQIVADDSPWTNDREQWARGFRADNGEQVIAPLCHFVVDGARRAVIDDLSADNDGTVQTVLRMDAYAFGAYLGTIARAAVDYLKSGDADDRDDAISFAFGTIEPPASIATAFKFSATTDLERTTAVLLFNALYYGA